MHDFIRVQRCSLFLLFKMEIDHIDFAHQCSHVPFPDGQEHTCEMINELSECIENVALIIFFTDFLEYVLKPFYPSSRKSLGAAKGLLELQIYQLLRFEDYFHEDSDERKSVILILATTQCHQIVHEMVFLLFLVQSSISIIYSFKKRNYQCETKNAYLSEVIFRIVTIRKSDFLHEVFSKITILFERL